MKTKFKDVKNRPIYSDSIISWPIFDNTLAPSPDALCHLQLENGHLFLVCEYGRFRDVIGRLPLDNTEPYTEFDHYCVVERDHASSKEYEALVNKEKQHLRKLHSWVL